MLRRASATTENSPVGCSTDRVFGLPSGIVAILAAGPADRPLKARVALYTADGNRVAQSDERILNDRHLMPGEWQPDDRPLNIYRLATPPDLAPGPYAVGLLVYDADTLDPVGFLDEAGNPAGVEVMIGEIDVKSED